MSVPPRLPGDLPRGEAVKRMIRVDHAGEYGAARIYAGQLAVLGRRKSAGVIRHMAEQEKRHLASFEKLVVERRVRPTLLSPLWHVAGFALGAATALLGEEAAMACTVAVEEVIDEHYGRQSDALAALPPEHADPELARAVEEFRADELEHRDTARDAGATSALGYPLLSAAIRAGCRAAIELSKRI